MDTGYSPNNGEYPLQLGTPTKDNNNNWSAPIVLTLGASSLVIGHVVVDSGHIIIDSGAITANAGTNLNTSALALETGGNLSTLASAIVGSIAQANIAKVNGAAPNLAQETGGNLATLAGAITAAIMQANISKVGGTSVGNTNPLPTQFVSQSGYVALTSPPASTNANSDTALTFSSQIDTVIIQNNTAVNVNYAFDVAATLGALLLTPGQALIYSKKITVVHLFTVTAQNLNGSSAGNIVLLGEL